MATFEIVEGNVGQGKSLYTAKLVQRILKRNKKWFRETGQVRKIYSNIKFSTKFEAECGRFLEYWTNLNDIITMKDADLVWDEIATELDARNFANLSEDIKRFLSQYRKRGIDIYANTQDFSMIDARARLMVTRVASLNKVIGSRDPSSTKPAIKYIWGLVMIREVESILADDPHNKRYIGIPSFFLIDREDVKIYDTRQDIPQSPPLALRHIFRKCEFHSDEKHHCTFTKVQHS